MSFQTSPLMRHLCLLLLALLWMGPLTATEKPLTVVMDDNYPPYVFRAEDGTLKGYLPELWQRWEEKTGRAVSLLATDWVEAQRLHASGKVDVIDTIFRTPEREQYLAFSPPYANLPVSIYTDKNLGGITNIESLRGFLVGVKEGDACVADLTNGGVTNLKTYASYAQVIDAAISQEVKIFCLDEPPANFLLYRAGADQAFHKAFSLSSGQFHRAVRQEKQALMHELQRGFDAITPQEMQRLKDKWLGSPLNLTPWFRHLWIALAVLFVVACLVTIWVLLLRRAVRERTTQLAQEQARLRTLIDTMPDLVWLKSVDGVYQACNPKFEQFFGAREADIIGKTDYDFVPKELADLFTAHDRKAMENDGSTNEEWVTFADDGHRELLETTKTPMRDSQGNIIGVLGISHDITERKHIEQRQHENEERLRMAMDSARQGSFDLNLASGESIVSPEYEQLLGYAPGEYHSTRDNWLNSIHPDDRGMVEENFAKICNTDTTAELIYRRRKKSGEWIWIISSGRVVERDTNGKPLRMMGIHMDITERRQAEIELEAYRNHLEALVKARTVELHAAKQAAEAANIAKSAFLANISHEMRTPLHHVISMASLIRREPLTEKQTGLMSKLDIACHTLASTMDTVLKLTRVESGKLDLSKEPFDPGKLVAEALSLTQEQASAKHLCLQYEGLPSHSMVVGDHGYIKQALLNYINNAIRFTETGSITVRLQQDFQGEDRVLLRFEVTDTGIGIAPEDQSRLFSLFEQIDNSPSRKYGGLGAGLALTKKIAELMGGDAGCNSKLGEGSTFWFSVMLEKA